MKPSRDGRHIGRAKDKSSVRRTTVKVDANLDHLAANQVAWIQRNLDATSTGAVIRRAIEVYANHLGELLTGSEAEAWIRAESNLVEQARRGRSAPWPAGQLQPPLGKPGSTWRDLCASVAPKLVLRVAGGKSLELPVWSPEGHFDEHLECPEAGV